MRQGAPLPGIGFGVLHRLSFVPVAERESGALLIVTCRKNRLRVERSIKTGERLSYKAGLSCPKRPILT
jgi:hypothetical protein